MFSPQRVYRCLSLTPSPHRRIAIQTGSLLRYSPPALWRIPPGGSISVQRVLGSRCNLLPATTSHIVIRTFQQAYFFLRAFRVRASPPNGQGGFQGFRVGACRRTGTSRHLARAKDHGGNESQPRGQPSLIATIIDTDSTQTWTTYEAPSPNSKRISSAGSGGANAREINRGLVDVRRVLVRRARFLNQNLVSRRAAVANKKETDPKPRTKTSERALLRKRTHRTGSLRRHPRPNWSSGR